MDEKSTADICLTAREIEVACLMLKHFNIKKVADKLSLSSSTISFFCAALRKKMQSSYTLEAAFKAKELGLLERKD